MEHNFGNLILCGVDLGPPHRKLGLTKSGANIEKDCRKYFRNI